MLSLYCKSAYICMGSVIAAGPPGHVAAHKSSNTKGLQLFLEAFAISSLLAIV